MTLRQCGIRSKNLSINAKSLQIGGFISGTLRASAGSCLCAHASWLRAQADSYVRMPRASLTLFF